MSVQLFQYHPVIGFTFIPGLKARLEHEAGGYLVRVNAAGFRSEREFVREKSPGTFRILLFGDSFTAGDGVSNKFRYSDVLEKNLSGIEVYNFGLPGTGTDQHYLTYREIAREYEHDLVVIAVQVENIRRIAARWRVSLTAEGTEVCLAKPYFELKTDGTLELCQVPVPKEPLRPDELSGDEKAFLDRGGRFPLMRKLVGGMGGRVKALAQQISRFQPLPQYDTPDSSEWQLMKAILRQWTGELAKPAIIMPIPLYHYVEETASSDAYRARFAELGRELVNTPIHDPLPEYLVLPTDERRAFRFETDIHPTPAHHQFLASTLARVISARIGNAMTAATNTTATGDNAQ